jgi:hypothetical protein
LSFLPPAMTEYNESSYLGYLTELRMEFYIKLLQMLVKPKFAFSNVLGGKKAMHTMQVIPMHKLRWIICFSIVDSLSRVKVPTLICEACPESIEMI